MIHRMIDVYEQRINANEWLSPATKQKAITKLRALVLKIGYPDKIEHVYDLFQVEDDLYSTQANMREVDWKYNFAKLYKPVDRSEWYMPGNLINACYDPQRMISPSLLLSCKHHSMILRLLVLLTMVVSA